MEKPRNDVETAAWVQFMAAAMSRLGPEAAALEADDALRRLRERT